MALVTEKATLGSAAAALKDSMASSVSTILTPVNVDAIFVGIMGRASRQVSKASYVNAKRDLKVVSVTGQRILATEITRTVGTTEPASIRVPEPIVVSAGRDLKAISVNWRSIPARMDQMFAEITERAIRPSPAPSVANAKTDFMDNFVR